MREFPQVLNVKNKDKFSDIYYKRVLCYLRKDVYEHIIHQDENNYFDLEKFGRVYFNGNPNRDDIISKMVTAIKTELECIGWKCKLSFHGSALFIYSTENPPPSCWDDTF